MALFKVPGQIPLQPELGAICRRDEIQMKDSDFRYICCRCLDMEFVRDPRELKTMRFHLQEHIEGKSVGWHYSGSKKMHRFHKPSWLK